MMVLYSINFTTWINFIMKTNSTMVIEQISFIKGFETDFVIVKTNSDIIEVTIINIIILVNYIMMVDCYIMVVNYIIIANYIKMVDYIKMVSYIKAVNTNTNLNLAILMGQLQALLYCW